MVETDLSADEIQNALAEALSRPGGILTILVGIVGAVVGGMIAGAAGAGGLLRRLLG